MTKKHQKHSKIAKPALGEFGRVEFSILGTPCGDIKKIASLITHALQEKFKIAYIDADHKSADNKSNLTGTSLAEGFEMEYVDKIDFHRTDFHGTINKFTQKKHFVDQDLVIVNGNHFESNCQIVVLDPRKSLEKKLGKLTNVELLITTGSDMETPNYLTEHLDIANIPTINIDDHDQLITWAENKIASKKPVLNGLVLVGGKSERMQQDKSLIAYHGKSQKAHMTDLLGSMTAKSFLSVREDQEVNDQTIKDTFTGLGPYGAILSAFRHDPNAAWLVTACDQPYIDEAVIQNLIDNRNTSKVATAFYNPETDFPEPLITIWEPRAYAYLLDFLSQGYSCPRKVLINTDIELIKLEDASVLRNANTPEEAKLAMNELSKTD
ncbi:MAG: NTP transferase domain-containing protein [Reichenbachiella sp.]